MFHTSEPALGRGLGAFPVLMFLKCPPEHHEMFIPPGLYLPPRRDVAVNQQYLLGAESTQG